MTKNVCIATKNRDQHEPAAQKILTGCNISWLNDMDPASRLEALKNADAVLAAMLTSEFSPEEKMLLGRPGIVQTISAGVDQVDFSTLPPDIKLCSNTGGWAHSMAEHALAMTLACTRMLRPQTESLKDGVYDTYAYPMRQLEECTILFVGWGGIAHAASRLFKPFGSRLIALGRTAPQDEVLSRGYAQSEIKEALADADIVLLSLPDTNATHHMMNAETLAAMKDDAILVNVARAGLIDRDALYEHLRTHPRFFAALDVWWNERKHYPSDGEPLLKLPNAIGTAHNSWISPSSRFRAAENAMRNIAAYFEGRPVKGRVKVEEYVTKDKA